MYGVPDAVEAAVRVDRLDEVSAHADRFRHWAEQSRSPEGLALLARCLGLIDAPNAGEHFARAIELAPALSPFDEGRSELLYGEWLRRQRRRIDARRHLRGALERFGRLGTPPWEARARSELRASGETARRRDPSTLDQLTPQELQISRLVATGMTNPESGGAAVSQPSDDRLPPAQGVLEARYASRATASQASISASRDCVTGESWPNCWLCSRPTAEIRPRSGRSTRCTPSTCGKSESERAYDLRRTPLTSPAT